MMDNVRANIDSHLQAVRGLTNDHLAVIVGIAASIVRSIGAGGKVMIAGNGGSAADAQHIAGELVGRLIYDRRPLPAIALSTDTSVLTSVANDYGFDDVFVRQVEALIRDNDIFWGLSTSGNSTNIIAAADVANRRNAVVIAFTGAAGGELAARADLCFKSPAERTDRIQEIHVLAYHIVCQLVEESLCPR